MIKTCFLACYSTPECFCVYLITFCFKFLIPSSFLCSFCIFHAAQKQSLSYEKVEVMDISQQISAIVLIFPYFLTSFDTSFWFCWWEVNIILLHCKTDTHLTNISKEFLPFLTAGVNTYSIEEYSSLNQCQIMALQTNILKWGQSNISPGYINAIDFNYNDIHTSRWVMPHWKWTMLSATLEWSRNLLVLKCCNWNCVHLILHDNTWILSCCSIEQFNLFLPPNNTSIKVVYDGHAWTLYEV